MRLWSVFTQRLSNSIVVPTQWKLYSENKTLIFKEAHSFVLINQYAMQLVMGGKSTQFTSPLLPFPWWETNYVASNRQSNPFVRAQSIYAHGSSKLLLAGFASSYVSFSSSFSLVSLIILLLNCESIHLSMNFWPISWQLIAIKTSLMQFTYTKNANIYKHKKCKGIAFGGDLRLSKPPPPIHWMPKLNKH